MIVSPPQRKQLPLRADGSPPRCRNAAAAVDSPGDSPYTPVHLGTGGRPIADFKIEVDQGPDDFMLRVL